MEQRLKELRKARRITQDILGYEIGMSQQNISRYEKSIQTIPVDMLIKFSDYYKVTTDYLLGISNIRQRLESERVESKLEEEYGNFVDVFEGLSERDREVVWCIMNKMRELNVQS